MSIAALDNLRARLEALGFIVGNNNLAGRDNDCRWYAWRRITGAVDCQCNDRPPSLIVTPHLYTLHDRQSLSVEVSITGQQGDWFQLKAYILSLEELPDALPGVEAALARAWNALAAGGAAEREAA